MIDKQLITKILRSARRRSRGLKDHNLMHPTREWFSGLAVGFILLLSGTAWCVYLYWGYSTVEPETAAEIDAPVNIYQKATVEAALAELSARAARYEEFRTTLEARRFTSTSPEEAADALQTVSPDATSSTSTLQAEPSSTDTVLPEIL